MDQGLIPSRYAKALYKVCDERRCTAQMYTVMQDLAKAFVQNPTLASVLDNPFVSVADKTKLLETAAGTDTAAEPGKTFGDFLRLLAQNKRLDLAKAIANAYIALYRKANGIHTVHVTSATPLADATRKRIQDIVTRQLGANGTMEYSEDTDPALIGGFTVNLDNQRLDASVRNELKQLRLKLID